MASRMMQSFDPTDKEACLGLLEVLTSNAPHVQQQILGEILTKNANTEYLKRFLNGSTNVEVFKTKIPMVEYEDFYPYIERIANGEPSELISAQPITGLIMSSGTSSGKFKLLPSTAEEPARKGMFQLLSANVLNKYVEGLNQGRLMLFIFSRPDINTPSGLVATNATCNHLKNLKPTKNFNPLDALSSPIDVILCPDNRQSMYCQLLCGLLRRFEVVKVGSPFASGFLRVIKFLEENWQEICSNIRNGQISDWIKEPKCRNAVSLILNKEMPDLAEKIEEICYGSSWEGIIKKLWPRTKIVEAINTGTMAQYVPLLEFYSGGLPLVSLLYNCSEGYFGINLEPLSKPEDVSYTLIPNMAYYEFLPIDQPHQEKQEDQQNGETKKDHDQVVEDGLVDLANVKICQSYELVVTTCTGLYRYRVGDILMVTGFYNKAPKFKFVQRRNVVLSVDIEKTTEEDLLKAVTKAMQILEPNGFLLTDYTSYIDASSIPGHYVLFWELQKKGNFGQEIEIDGLKMEECCAVVEQSLDYIYRMLRNRSNVIGPLEIKVVKKGAFEELMELLISKGSSLSQYKTPKCIKLENAIQLMNSKVVGTFSSQCVPTK